MSVKNALDAFGKRVQQQSRSNLTKAGKKTSGDLYNSIGYNLEVHRNSFHFSFTMEDYGPYVDKGVKGVNSSDRAPQSPFKFGTGNGKKGGLTDAIQMWAAKKRIQFKDRKTGKFMSYNATAFLMARAIYNKGIETTNFFTKPFENEFRKLPDEVVEGYGLEVDDFLNRALR